MKRTLLLTTTLAALLALPARSSAQVDIEGATSISLGGFMFLGSDNGSINSTVGLNKFLAGGLELGGFLSLNATYTSGNDFSDSSTSTSGFAFGKLRYNMIGESMTVPFFEFGAGTQLDDPGEGASRPLLLQGGAGFKKFLNSQVSFDLTGNVQGTYIDGTFDFQNALFLTYGLTIYIN
jgi:hypothetical protein